MANSCNVFTIETLMLQKTFSLKTQEVSASQFKQNTKTVKTFCENYYI
jgi:hypothetical protein